MGKFCKADLQQWAQGIVAGQEALKQASLYRWGSVPMEQGQTLSHHPPSLWRGARAFTSGRFFKLINLF